MVEWSVIHWDGRPSTFSITVYGSDNKTPDPERPGHLRPDHIQRTHGYHGFIHFYNHHRPHGALGWATPTSILRDNLPKEHT
jgi:transposase InsO family protein